MYKELSILVVTFNRIDWLKKNLESIFNQKEKIKNIYIVNNNSTDETQKYLEELERKYNNIITINLKENIGGAGGFYEGVRKFLEFSDDNEWLSLMDDDCILAEDFSVEILKGNLNLNNAYIPFVYKIEDKKINPNFLKNLVKVNDNEYERDVFPFNGYTINKNLIKKIGLPIKEYFIYSDDYEYCYRVLENGGKNIAKKSAKIYHPTKNIRKDKRIKFLTSNELTRLGAYYGTRNPILCKIRHKKVMKYSIKKLMMINIYKIFSLICLRRFDLLILVLKGIKDGITNRVESKGRI